MGVYRPPLAAARAVPAPVDAVTAQATELARLEPAVRRGDARAVHRLRVTTRRLLSAVAVLAPPSSARTAVTARLDMLASAIGRVRDLDVFDVAVQRHGRRLDDPLRAGLRLLRTAIATERSAALVELVARLDGAGHRQLRMQLVALVASRPCAGDDAARRLQALVRDFRRAGMKAARRSTPRRLHRVRLRAKHLRYALEAVGATGAPAGRRLLRRLERLQVALGKGQDARAQIAWFDAHASSLPSVAAFAAGGLVQRLADELGRTRRGFAGRWRRLDRPPWWRALRRELRSNGSHG